MLKVQRFLKNCVDNPSADNGFELLTEHFGIKCNFHETLPLVILNYDQINSPKMHPIIMECRGLVLHSETFEVVAGCMKRFFNFGEALEITDKFDWESLIDSRAKEDGSLMTLFNYNDQWMVKTRNSWADFEICENGPKWDELFWSLLKSDITYFDPQRTYVFEMCSMYNQVVRQYPDPKLFLLTVIDNRFPFGDDDPDYWAKHLNLNRPDKIDITDQASAREYITTLEQIDGTAEGLVLYDQNGLRIKVKSSTYLAYSRLGGNGNLALDKNILPLILANEQEEAMAIFPQIKARVKEIELKITTMYSDLVSIYEYAKNIENQKEFALYVTKEHYTPFNSLLFKLKQTGEIKNLEKLRKMFYTSETLILKILELEKYGKSE